jgi:hypothetical protein
MSRDPSQLTASRAFYLPTHSFCSVRLVSESEVWSGMDIIYRPNIDVELSKYMSRLCDLSKRILDSDNFFHFQNIVSETLGGGWGGRSGTKKRN